MLNARGGLTGRVKQEKGRNLIPPPPTARPKAKRNLSCWLPFLWSTCSGFFVGLLIFLVGCAMSGVGLYAVKLSSTYNVTYPLVAGVTTEASVVVAKDEQLFMHLKNMLIIGPVVMGVGLTVVVMACTWVFEEREKQLKMRPKQEEEEKNTQKKGKYDLIVAKFREECKEEVNKGFEGDDAQNKKVDGNKRRSSVYSMDTAMIFANNILISPLHIDQPEGKNGHSPNITMSTTCLDKIRNDCSPSPEIQTENGWLKKSRLSEKRPNNRLMPLPSLSPLYSDEKDTTSLRDVSMTSSQASLNSTTNSIKNVPSKSKRCTSFVSLNSTMRSIKNATIKHLMNTSQASLNSMNNDHLKQKKNQSRDSSFGSLKQAADEKECRPEQNGGSNISPHPEVTVTEVEPVANDISEFTIVIQSTINDGVKNLHPEVLILDETKASPDYDSSDQGSGIIDTRWNSVTGHR